MAEPEQQNQQPPKMVGAAELLVQAAEAFKSGSPQMLLLVIFGVFLPQLLANWILAIPADRAVKALREMTQIQISSGLTNSDFFQQITEKIGNFTIVFTATTIFAWFIVGVAYLALIYLNLNQMRPWAFPEVSSGQLLRDMTKLGLRRGIWLVLLVGITVAITQAFPLTAVFLASLTLMAPVLMIAEHKSALRSFTHSLTIGYARKSPLGGWSAFLGLVTLGGLLFTLNFLIEWGANSLLDNLTATKLLLLSDKIPGLPFTIGYAVIDVAQTALISALIALLPGFTVALYMRLHFRNHRKTVKIKV